MFSLVAHVHAQGVVLHNVSDESFQFESLDADAVLFLVDYGDSRVVSDDASYGNIKGRAMCLSPELCRCIAERKKTKTWAQDITSSMYRASDVWALGVAV